MTAEGQNRAIRGHEIDDEVGIPSVAYVNCHKHIENGPLRQ